MNKQIAAFYLGTLAACVLTPGIALADGAAEGEIRTITPTEATSECVGDLSTPLCAVETLIGCSNYVRVKGCKKAYMGRSGNRQIRIEYIIVKTGFVDPEMVAKAKFEKIPSEFGSFPWLTPDGFQAKVKERPCPVKQLNCEKVPWLLTLYSVGPHGKNWTWAAIGVFVPRNWFVKE